MASVRNLKKDIDYLTSLVFVDCLQYISYFENADKKAATKIVEKLIASRNDLRKRVNHPDGKDNPALVKAYYDKIAHDLMDVCDKAYEELGKLVEKV